MIFPNPDLQTALSAFCHHPSLVRAERSTGPTESSLCPGGLFWMMWWIRVTASILLFEMNSGLQWSAVRVTPSGYPRDLNFSRTVAGITKWFWVSTEGYLSYLLPKFEDLIHTSLGDIAI